MMIFKFPFYKNDGKAAISLTKTQRHAINDFTAKLTSEHYRLVNNPCMCGAEDDIVVTDKDRYGIPCKYVLCRHCGLIRQQKRLDDVSTALFYRDDYRNIYVGKELATEEFFAGQVRAGEKFCSIVDKHIGLSAIHNVFESGCGAGGILYAFKQHGMTVSGCDFGEKYLQFGRDKGLSLYDGELDLNNTPQNSQDLVILSHVLEHINSPLDYMNNLIEIIAPGGYMLVQVPGIFSMREQYRRPIRYFQNAHVNNFYGHYLEHFFSVLGLEVIYSDEVCTFLLLKPKVWTKKNLGGVRVWDEEMPEWSRRVERSLKKCYLLSVVSPRDNIVRLLDMLHLKDAVKKALGR